MNIDWSIKFTDLVIVFATLVGPILAVWASEWRQRQRAEADRREWVFRRLMITRAARLSPEHVVAINEIQFAFPKSKFAKIEDARALYRRHLRNANSISTESAVHHAWFVRADELIAEMLYQMAQTLGVPFLKAEITEEAYHPNAFALKENELNEIRSLSLQVLKNGWPLNIRVVNDPVNT